MKVRSSWVCIARCHFANASQGVSCGLPDEWVRVCEEFAEVRYEVGGMAGQDLGGTVEGGLVQGCHLGCGLEAAASSDREAALWSTGAAAEVQGTQGAAHRACTSIFHTNQAAWVLVWHLLRKVTMESIGPVRPFTQRLLTEIAKLAGGVPEAAAEIGISLEEVSSLTTGNKPSISALYAVYSWLSSRVTLTTSELEDFDRLRDAAVSGQRAGQLEPAPGLGESPPRGRVVVRTWQLAGVIAAAMVVAVVVAVVIAVTIIRPSDPKGTISADQTPASKSPAGTSSTPSDAPTSPHPAAPASGTPGQASPSATDNAVIQWGPGRILVSSDGTDLSSVPPISDINDTGGNDYYYNVAVVGSGLSINSDNTVAEPASNAIMAWPGSKVPSAPECLSLIDNQGTNAQSVPVSQGTNVCLDMGSGLMAVIQVLSINGRNSTMETDTTVWNLPGA